VDDDANDRYAVFPERLEVMSQSNLMKVVGRVNGELVTIEGRLRESGWALIMPEAPGEGTASPPPSTPLANMMRWVTGESPSTIFRQSDMRGY
jgi:CCR4-NOT transcriptional complex subunit CAF120